MSEKRQRGIESYARGVETSRVVEALGREERFAESLADHPGTEVDLASVQTNIVFFAVSDPSDVVDRCAVDGVAMLTADPKRIRAVFHLDVSHDDTSRAIDVVTRITASS